MVFGPCRGDDRAEDKHDRGEHSHRLRQREMLSEYCFDGRGARGDQHSQLIGEAWEKSSQRAGITPHDPCTINCIRKAPTATSATSPAALLMCMSRGAKTQSGINTMPNIMAAIIARRRPLRSE